MVMEKGEKSLLQVIREGPMPVIDALKILSQLIKGLQFVHKQVKAIHGDIHPGNIMIDADGKVQLIDFELAEFEDELIRKEQYIGGHMTFVHCYLSHWNIEGSRFSYRDDVIKALYVTAILMHGNSFLDACHNMATTMPWSLYRWKKSKFLFELPEGPPIETLLIDRPKNIIDRVRARLEIITDMARLVLTLDAQPPYASMIEKIDSIVQLLQ
jgi:serine/threonine protein kinase